MKKYLLGIFAIVAAIGMSSYTNIQTLSRVSGSQYWLFNGSAGQENLPQMYSPEGQTNPCNSSGSHRCGVFAETSGTNQPVLDGTEIIYTKP